MSTTVYSQVVIHTAESTGALMERSKMPNLRSGTKGGFEPGLTWLRVRHSTAELPRSILNNKRTYKQLKKDPTNSYRTKLINLLKELKNSGAITHEQYYNVYPTATEPPKLYGLPMVHKPPCPLRPIVACRGSIMYGTARWVADILAPVVGKTHHHLQNSADLVNTLSQIRMDEDESHISFDVSALFTSVPVEENLILIYERLTAGASLSDRTALSPQQVTDLLRMCLTTTYFKYDGGFYAQIEGAAMGSPVSPIVANLFIEDYEGKALEAYQDQPKYWGRMWMTPSQWSKLHTSSQSHSIWTLNTQAFSGPANWRQIGNSPCSTPWPPECRMGHSSSVCTESRHPLISTCSSKVTNLWNTRWVSSEHWHTGRIPSSQTHKTNNQK